MHIAGSEGPIKIKQRDLLFAGIFDNNKTIKLGINSKNYFYIVKGNGQINDLIVNPEDGITIEDENKITINPETPMEVIWYSHI